MAVDNEPEEHDPAGAEPTPQEAQVDLEAVQGGFQWPWQRVADGK